MDAMDVSGDNQVDIEQTLYKQRLSESGTRIGQKINDVSVKVVIKIS